MTTETTTTLVGTGINRDSGQPCTPEVGDLSCIATTTTTTTTTTTIPPTVIVVDSGGGCCCCNQGSHITTEALELSEDRGPLPDTPAEAVGVGGALAIIAGALTVAVRQWRAARAAQAE